VKSPLSRERLSRVGDGGVRLRLEGWRRHVALAVLVSKSWWLLAGGVAWALVQMLWEMSPWHRRYEQLGPDESLLQVLRADRRDRHSQGDSS
jgi:hypothetical protein